MPARRGEHRLQSRVQRFQSARRHFLVDTSFTLAYVFVKNPDPLTTVRQRAPVTPRSRRRELILK
jgi:hypothetical protein